MRFFFILLLVSCANNSRRSDFIVGCYSGANLVSKSIGMNINGEKVIDYCINMYDSSGKDLQDLLNQAKDRIPPKDLYKPNIEKIENSSPNNEEYI